MVVGPLRCPKCGSEMTEGFLLETGLLSDPRQKWVDGRPVVGIFGIAKTAERDIRRVQTFRCIGCGLLESYAKEHSR
jgi:transposase